MGCQIPLNFAHLNMSYNVKYRVKMGRIGHHSVYIPIRECWQGNEFYIYCMDITIPTSTSGAEMRNIAQPLSDDNTPQKY